MTSSPWAETSSTAGLGLLASGEDITPLTRSSTRWARPWRIGPGPRRWMLPSGSPMPFRGTGDDPC
jgi:hypothetical protein